MARDSQETTGHLLQHMPYLLQDMWALGCSVGTILRLLADMKLPADTKILDLGCGKGALLIQLAKTFGFQCFGIDASLSFLTEARLKADQQGVSHLCHFFAGDIGQFTLLPHDFDMVSLASLGGLFGSLRKTMSILRTQIRSDGYIVINDGYLKNASRLREEGFQHYRNHDQSMKALSALGDRMICEVISTEENRNINQEYLEVIGRRGRELTAMYPALNQEILAFIDSQRKACNTIEKCIEGTVWLLQKANQ